MLRTISFAFLMSTTALPLLAQDAPVREVTLFEAGLAELIRETGDSSEVALRVPLTDVDDVLKSLLVRGTGITTASMALSGPDPVADAFASLPFPPEAATDLQTLLRTVPGLRVAIAYPGEAQGSEGVILQAGENCTDAEGCRTTVTVLHDDGALRRHILDSGTDMTILDADISEALRTGLAALRSAASGNARVVTVALEGTDIADGALSYVISAPSWKTAYRALIDGSGAQLQAWAVIENATGEDWEDVRLTLSSGSPRTLSADLFGRAWQIREQMPVSVVEAITAAPSAARLEDSIMGGFAAEVMDMPAVVVGQTVTSEGVLDSRFTFDHPIDIAAGNMLSMPFLSEALDAESLVLWQGAQYTRTGNPDLFLNITNSLPVRLPAGIMTVSDETGGYIGDAAVPVVAPGETREVTYGADRGIRIEEQVDATRRRVSIRLANGALRIQSEDRRTSIYTAIVQNGAERLITIDHPLIPGWTSAIEAREGLVTAERQDDSGMRWLRIPVPVEASPEGPGDFDVTVIDTMPIEEVVAFETLDSSSFLYWSGEATTPEDRAFLSTAADLAKAASAANAALAAAETQTRTLIADQMRISTLVQALESGTPAYDRFITQLLQAEDDIAAATLAEEAARADLAERQAALAAHLATI